MGMSESQGVNAARRNGHPPTLLCFICSAPVSSPEGVFCRDPSEYNYGICDAHLARGPVIAWAGDGTPLLMHFRDEQEVEVDERAQQPGPGYPGGQAGGLPDPAMQPGPTPLSPTEHARMRLVQALDMLDGEINELQVRLQPVLAPVSPEETTTGPDIAPVPPQSQVAATLHEFADRVEKQTRNVRHIIGRIEV